MPDCHTLKTEKQIKDIRFGRRERAISFCKNNLKSNEPKRAVVDILTGYGCEMVIPKGQKCNEEEMISQMLSGQTATHLRDGYPD